LFKHHPKGLPVLFFSEMWERFGFYLLLGIFTLYMLDTQQGGLGLSEKQAFDIYGTYLAIVYLTPFIGGLLADRVLGYRKSIVIGGILMGFGYCGLAIPGYGPQFWLSLLLIILGNGFFKPNISALVGKLYADPKYAANKDAGFNIFYMGINLGAFISNFVAAYLRNEYGWGHAFAAAGIGMFVGVAWFLAGQRFTAEADVMEPPKPGDESVGRILAKVLLPAATFGLIGWFVPSLVSESGNWFGSSSNDAFLFACLPVTWFYVSLWSRSDGEDKERVGGLLPIFAVVIVFWAIFHQNGSALTVWAEDYTDRNMPTAIADTMNEVGFAQEVDTSLRDVPARDAHGDIVVGVDGKAIVTRGPHPYFHNLDQEHWPADGNSLTLVSTELFQSINPFFVVILTPVLVVGFGFLRRFGKEPSTPGKIVLGLLVTALSTMVMITAVFVTHNGASKASAWWLVLNYLLITFGELSLSPMGLSLVSKLSPPRLTAVMMGGWFLVTAIGNKLSGILSGLLGYFDHKAAVFAINCAGALLAAGFIWLMVPRLRNIMSKYADR